MTHSLKPSSYFRRCAFGIPLFCVVLLGSITPATAQGPVFDKHELVTDAAMRKSVLTGFLLDTPMADIITLDIDNNQDRRLRTYTFDDDSWKLEIDATLRPNVAFADVANIGGLDRLITYEPGRLNWFDPETSKERVLVEVSSNFKPPRKNEVPHVDITHDVNSDGRDDLVVPDADGYSVFIQTSDGTFADPLKAGPPTDLSRIYGADGYRYDPWSQSRVYEIDYNQDGRSDLVFWNVDRFDVHVQDEDGRFTSTTNTFTTPIKFDSDNLNSLIKGDMTGRVLHSLADVNGDGLGDMVIVTVKGRRSFSKESTYAVHFGKTLSGGMIFSQLADITFEADRSIQIAMDRYDLNRDGRSDLMFTTIDRKYLTNSLWKTLKGMMGDDVRLRLEFYRVKDGAFAQTPNTIRTIALDGSPSHREPGAVSPKIVLEGGQHANLTKKKDWPRAFNVHMLIGDVTGDGLSDLLIEHSFRGLDVYAGVHGPELFSREGHPVKVTLPNDEEYSWLVDLNKDGKQDIVMHQPFTERDVHGAPIHPPGTEPQRVTILIAK